MTEALLQVDDLAVRFRTDGGTIAAVTGVSFTLDAGETLAIVGESSSGKSVTALALMRLLAPPPSCAVSGRVHLRGKDGVARDLLTLDDHAMRAVRGGQMAMVFQEPMSSLNPVHTIGAQIAEAVIEHEQVTRRQASRRAVEMLDLVGIPEPARRMENYPHQLSGGMRQRAMIAMALACGPRVLIADEPTTALDVTIQAQILDLLRRLQQASGMAIIFITHNLGVVAEIADRVIVMYAGQVVEQAPVAALFRAPRMPYTAGLLRSVPRLDAVLHKGGVLDSIPGNVPDPRHRPDGCRFHPRCAHMQPAACAGDVIGLERVAEAHDVRCSRWRMIAA